MARKTNGATSLTVENYVKVIFNLCVGNPRRHAATGEIATALHVSPGTVTSMLKALSEAGLALYTPYEGARLTETGTKLALAVIRRHRLVELFLTKSLGLKWDEVHDEAEEIEHVMSDFLESRIDGYLGHPKFDPHGDPIPRPDGTMEEMPGDLLAHLDPGTHFRLVRVLDQSPEFLRHLSHAGLGLNVQGRVVENGGAGGTVSVLINGRPANLGRQAAMRIVVATEAPAVGPRLEAPAESVASAAFGA